MHCTKLTPEHRLKRFVASSVFLRPRFPRSAVARKSIVASRNIKAGELFLDKNLTVKRPGSRDSPMRWNEVIGRVASRDFAANDLIDL